MTRKTITYLSLLAIGILLSSSATTAQNMQQADQQFASISRLLESADAAFQDKAYADANSLYGASVRSYEEFSSTFPTFAPDLVRFRIAYCRNQMAAIRQVMAAPEANKPQTEAPQTPILIPTTIAEKISSGETPALQSARDQLAQEKNPAALLMQAAIQVQSGKFDEARKTLERFLAKHPNEPAANYNMAQLLLREAEPDFEKARQYYQRAIANGIPRDPDLDIVLNFE